MMRSRLQWQIFKALAVTGILCALTAAGVAWLLRDERAHLPTVVRDVAAFIVDELPENDPAAFERALKKRAKRLHASISVWDRHGRPLAHAGRKLPGPNERGGSEWIDAHDGVFVPLDDGRSVAISLDRGQRWTPPHLWMPLGLLAIALVLGSYWAARRITRRLSQLEASVSRFGQGELEVRAEERGDDEIARLARSFNHSAARIADLLRTQRRMLQSASHELRSPLARLRMALELFGDGIDEEQTRKRLASDAERDVVELDELIDELLLAARLEDSELPKEMASVDLAAIARAETCLLGASARIEELMVTGNARMLKSLIRNLLENAKRHGREPVSLTLQREGNEAVLSVEDAGDGVPLEDRARIFEPFYRATGAREGRGGGTGLGLSLVRSVARHHGGDVVYISLPHGSRFEARWPIA